MPYEYTELKSFFSKRVQMNLLYVHNVVLILQILSKHIRVILQESWENPVLHMRVDKDKSENFKTCFV